MYVIIDLEWFETIQKDQHPTQLAALRVDDNWEIMDEFNSLIRPGEGIAVPWWHVSFAGASMEEFLQADSVEEVFERFAKWLYEDDILCFWRDKPSEMFEQMNSSMSGCCFAHEKKILMPYFERLAKDGQKIQGNPYEMCRCRGLDTPKEEHCSYNDVRVVRQLMALLDVPVSELEQQALVGRKRERKELRGYLFLCNEDTGLLHTYDSSCLEQIEHIKGIGTIKKCIDQQYRPCPECCMEIWNQKLREYNQKVVKDSRCDYFFIRGKNVFHTGGCEEILMATDRCRGVTYYDTCIRHGKIPCELCRPEPGRIRIPIPSNEPKEKIKLPAEAAIDRRWMTKNEKEALKRYQEALEELNALSEQQLSTAQRRDMTALTATRYAFWAAAGYRNFHLRKCRRLKGLSNLKGFGTFQQAMIAGYQPCRECRPTAKHDVQVFMPLNTVRRENETIEDILELCRQVKIEADYQEPMLLLKTPAAEWRIDTQLNPIVPEHKPGSSPEFHRQHRMFLSLFDVVRYIERHDTKDRIEFENVLMDSKRKWQM